MTSHTAPLPTGPHPKTVLLGTDWAALSHAYGSAEDTPLDLMGLLDEDPEQQGAALGALEMSVLHQGSLYSATAPSALFIAGILADPRTATVHESFFPWDDRVRPLRAALLEWLAEFADSAAHGEHEQDAAAEDHEDEDEAQERADRLACRAVRPQLYAAVVPFLDDEDASVREAALGAVTHLVLDPRLADRLPEAAERVVRLVRAGGERRERSAALMVLAHWGHDTAEFLADPDPAVRACAALGSADPAAVDVLLAALADPAAADHWFDEPLPHADGWFRFALLRGLLDRATDFEQVLPAASALLPQCGQYTVDNDWGPLLAFAFPRPHRAGAHLTQAQRAYLTALVAHDPCWGVIANRVTWLRRAGLPTTREDLRTLLDTTPSRG